MVILACTLVAMLTIAGLVIDIGFAYASGRQDQNVADFAALAAARHLPGDPSGGCTAGWEYIKANLSDLPSGATSPCGSFPSSCDSTLAATAYTATSTGDYTVTFRYPVPDTDSLMGTPRVSDDLPADDTDIPCERFGVQVRHKDGVFFSSIAGVGALDPTASAVARQTSGMELTKVANLVSLDPTGCTGISVSGTGTDVLVGTAALPGSIAVDSDGSACTGQQTTVSAGGSSGSGAELYACPNPLSQNTWCPTTSSQGPGQILLHAMAGNATSCSVPACSTADYTGDRLGPQPVTNSERVTRSVADYAYDCKTSYPVAYDGVVSIDPCYTGTSPYIDDLISDVQADASDPAAANFTVIDKNSNGGCSPSSETLTGNYWVDCTNFNIQGSSVTFNGNVVFSKLAGTAKSADISISGGGSLTITGSSSVSLPSGCDTSVCLNDSSQGAATVYINGNLTSTGSNSSVTFTHTFVYVTAYTSADVMSSPSNFGCSSGTANYVRSASGATQSWSAPTEGPFTNLSLWSEGASSQFQLTGGGNSSIDGVFFTPCATPFSIAGGFTNPQTAQFLSFQLAVSGGSQVMMVPDPTRLLKTAPTGSELIR